jgi:VanZ family protein
VNGAPPPRASPSGAPPPWRRQPRGLVWLWLPVVITMAGIYYGASIPEPPMPPHVDDKSLHWGGYFVLTLLLIRAVAREQWSGVTLRAGALSVAIALAHGASVEWLQAYLPYRHADVRDLIADAIGAAAASAVAGAWSIIRRL